VTAKFLSWLQALIRDGNVHPFYISTDWRKARAKAIKYWHGECYRCRYMKTPSTLVPATMVHHVRPVKKFPQYALSLFVVGQAGEQEIQLMPLCHDCHAAVEAQSKISADYPEKW